jgi:hypothetical protein
MDKLDVRAKVAAMVKDMDVTVGSRRVSVNVARLACCSHALVAATLGDAEASLLYEWCLNDWAQQLSVFADAVTPLAALARCAVV